MQETTHHQGTSGLVKHFTSNPSSVALAEDQDVQEPINLLYVITDIVILVCMLFLVKHKLIIMGDEIASKWHF